MEKLSLISGLVVLSLVTVGVLWSAWPCVVGMLALIGLARVVWVWRNRTGRAG